MSIKARLLLLIIVAALPVFLLYLWSEVANHRQRHLEAEDQLLRSARLLAAQQDQFFQRAESLLGTMLVGVSDDWRESERCNAYLARLAERNPAYTGFGVATPDGTIVCSSIPERMLGMSLADRSYFQDVLANHDFSIGDVTVGPASGRAIVGLALPLLGPDGSVELAGISGLDLTGLSETISASALPPHGVAVVFNEHGSVMARMPNPEEWVGKVQVPELAQADSDMVEATGVDGVERLWAVAPLLPEMGVHAALGIPAPDAVAQADRLFFQGMALLLLVFIGAGLAATFIGERSIRRPLENLELAVARLREGDLDARSSELGSARELIHLGQSFNEMAESLQQRDRELEEKNAQLEKLAAERELLMREMNHRVKNSLQLVSSMIGLQSRAVADPDAKARLADAQSRVGAVAKVHERLYQAEDLERVDAGRYLAELCQDLSESAGLTGRGGAITCHVADCKLPADKAIPLGIIATELATNAMKHAYPAEMGMVHVELTAENGVCRLSVSDGGEGVGPEFETTEHSGIGMKVVRAMVQQLGAKFEIDRLHPGTRFTVEISDEPLPAPH
jgi:two-component sensor histidine kinase